MPSPLRILALQKMLGYAGDVSEIAGSNRHPIIDKASFFTGQPVGSPYCVAIAMWAVGARLAEQNGIDVHDMEKMKLMIPDMIRDFMPFSASCTFQMEQAKDMGIWIPFEDIKTARKGDHIVLDFSRNSDKVIRHYAVIMERYNNRRLITVEGNTVSQYQGGAVDNDPRLGGVWVRSRSRGILGAIRVGER